MKKFINDPQAFVKECVEGIAVAHSDELRLLDEAMCFVRQDSPKVNKVAIITGGGSGHLPVFLGYVGYGLCDGVAIGEVFQSPSADQIIAAAEAACSDAGVLFLFGNYSGDVMNFDMASEILDMQGIICKTVLVSDDVASAPRDSWQKRRGVAGLFFAYKIAGAKAETLANLDEVTRLAEKVVARTRSMGVAVTPCIIPEVGKPTFEIGENEMEIGMGIHGERGIHRGELRPADEVTTKLMDEIIGDLPFESGAEVAVLVNGLGATPLEELYIVYRKVHEILQGAGIRVYRNYIGEFATSMEMGGFSITLLHLDDELKELLDAPAKSPFFLQPGPGGMVRAQ
ncbi:MAG: dihydroxyacetone kinase subunit DhaK [Firmicutes bacterium]|nr:dihydroxyacetone kinase subunit DhaK [Bacillota bacterium]